MLKARREVRDHRCTLRVKKTILERLSNLAKVTQLIDRALRTLSRQLINT